MGRWPHTPIDHLRQEWGLDPEPARVPEPVTPASGWLWCSAHRLAFRVGEFHGCHPSFVRPAQPSEIPKAAPARRSQYQMPPEESAWCQAVTAHSAEQPPQPVLDPARDVLGRYTGMGKADPPRADERMSREEIIAALRRTWFQLPRGAKKPLAREVGLPLPTLRGIVHRRATILESARRRLSRFLARVERGELRLVELHPRVPKAKLWAENRPSHAWQPCAPRRYRITGSVNLEDGGARTMS